ncbi:histone deacetylase [Leekyejoonella antrihumi]|uniref:Histone deacetylase n=1 Tax=Leekyejoonella antrihumi TaxID=1660198 RepID=A0A563DW46_9MICO|nr:histone deacetylase [Leekyejoonella antrihumi]
MQQPHPFTHVWYVSYGSNLCRERLLCYLQGGRPPGARRSYVGARDHAAPQTDSAVDLPGRIYFAGESSVWGGGVAFYDHDQTSPGGFTPARAYLLTVQQFVDVAVQEMHRDPHPDDPLELVVGSGLAAGRFEAGPGTYETLIEVGRRDGLPMLTFTAPHGTDDVRHTPPSPAYLHMLAEGLREAYHWDNDRITGYFDAVTPPTSVPSADLDDAP